MDAEEAQLHWALTTQAADAMTNISVEAARPAVRDGLSINEADFSMRAFAPENFLFVFNTQVARDRVLRSGRAPVSSTFLVFR